MFGAVSVCGVWAQTGTQNEKSQAKQDQAAPAQSSPAQGSSAQGSSAQGSSVQGSSVQGSSVQISPVQISPVQGSPAQPIADQDKAAGAETAGQGAATGAKLSDKQKQLADDTARLLVLARELQAEMDKSTKDTLSLSVMKKAQEVEKLAHKVREEMLASMAN